MALSGSGGIRQHGESLVTFDRDSVWPIFASRRRRRVFEPQQRGSGAVVQILGKLYFFELIENLRRILLDYAQKRTGRANANFNAAC
jgi:hypothetical protein